MTPRMSSSVSDSSRSSRLRDSSGEMTEKKGFSVVAATRVTQRFSTPGSSASCWALLNRCTSSTNSTVSRPPPFSSARAASIAARTSLTPAETAETSTNRRPVLRLRIEAIVVLPVPGGPHSSSDMAWSPSTSCRSGEPAARQLLLADQLVERAWAHPDGQWRPGVVGRAQRAAPAGTVPARSCPGRSKSAPDTPSQ